MKRLLGLLLALGLAAEADAQQTYLLIVSGLGGEPAYTEQFHGWATKLIDAAQTHYGLPAERMWYLAEKPELDPARIAGRSTRENVEATLRKVAELARGNDHVLIVVFGHGSSTAEGSRVNLPGPDLSAEEFAGLLGALRTQRVTFVNTASASGGFIQALAGQGRTIVTATRTAGERNETVFGGFFVEAFADGAEKADQNKDRRVSVLEAFNYAKVQVAHTYEQDGKLLTEHAMLDDDGDGKGTDAPDPLGGDGMLARSLYITAGAEGVADAALPDDPQLRALYEERRALEERVEALRVLRAGRTDGRYEPELEQVLIELARTSRTIRDLEAQKSGVEPR